MNAGQFIAYMILAFAGGMLLEDWRHRRVHQRMADDCRMNQLEAGLAKLLRAAGEKAVELVPEAERAVAS